MANGTLKVSNIETSSGSGTITLGQSGETITVPSGATVSGAMSNTPGFKVNLASTQTVSSGSATLAAFATELFDTDSAFTNTSSNYKFTVPSGKAGKYFLNASLNLRDVSQSQTINFARVSIYKNGSEFASNTFNHSGNYGDQYTINVSTIDNASASDYYQVYGTVTTSDASDGEFLSDSYRSWFCGNKLIG
jgi:hypothetical protein